MIYADFHTHCNFSTDSEASAESMVTGAIKKGLTHLCLTDHMDLDYPGTTKEQPLFEFCPEAYFKALSPLKEAYAEHLCLSIGVEYGLRPDRQDLNRRMRQMLSDYPFDFTLGSVHLIDNEDPYDEDFWMKHIFSARNVLVSYFNHTLSSIKEFDGFDSLSHLDYIIRYLPASLGEKDYCYKEYAEVIDEILKILIAKDKALEINTKGLTAGLSCFHPKLEIVTRYFELGGRLITIGSDAHTPEYIGTAFKKTEELLRSLGVKGYYVYRQHVPEFIPF